MGLTVTENGKRVRVTTIANRLSRSRGGTWVHEHDDRMRSKWDREKWQYQFPRVFGSFFSNSGDFFYRLDQPSENEAEHL